MSETDPMTSLMNYRGICLEVEKLIQQNTPFSLAIIDIDNFREYNKQSYRLGDEVIVEFAEMLRKHFKKDALYARFRIGDEFVIVFPHKSIQESTKAIEDFKNICLNAEPATLKDFEIKKISFSEGLAQFDTANKDIENLFSQAEISLKRNKQSG